MPTLARIDGISIRMYFEDHGQPHVHAAKAEREGKYFWRTGKWIGSLPPAETRKVEV